MLARAGAARPQPQDRRGSRRHRGPRPRAYSCVGTAIGREFRHRRLPCKSIDLCVLCIATKRLVRRGRDWERSHEDVGADRHRHGDGHGSRLLSAGVRSRRSGDPDRLHRNDGLRVRRRGRRGRDLQEERPRRLTDPDRTELQHTRRPSCRAPCRSAARHRPCSFRRWTVGSISWRSRALHRPRKRRPTPWRWWPRPETPIRTAQDFVGKKVGVPGIGAFLDVLFRQWLIQSGVDPKSRVLRRSDVPDDERRAEVRRGGRRRDGRARAVAHRQGRNRRGRGRLPGRTFRRTSRRSSTPRREAGKRRTPRPSRPSGPRSARPPRSSTGIPTGDAPRSPALPRSRSTS